MAEFNQTCHTITELRNTLRTDSLQDTFNITVDASDTDNVLDFNNENFYYFDGDFLPFAMDNANHGGTMNLDFNGTTLSNIYINNNKSLFKRTNFYYGGSVDNSADTKITISNGIFEIFSNNGFIADMSYNVSHNYYGWVSADILTFKNCVFNIRSFGMNHGLFRHKQFQFNFINCVFNVVNSGTFHSLIDFTDYRNNPSSFNPDNTKVNIQSCEFRTYFLDQAPSKALINLTGSKFSSIEINNNLFFIDALWTDQQRDIPLILTDSTISASKLFSNNFIGAFRSYDPNDKKVRIDFTTGAQIIDTAIKFIDSDKLAVSSNVGQESSIVLLTTAQCKNREALLNAGYVFATEM